MKKNLDFELGFIYGLITYHAVGFFGALIVAAAGFILGNLLFKLFGK